MSIRAVGLSQNVTLLKSVLVVDAEPGVDERRIPSVGRHFPNSRRCAVPVDNPIREPIEGSPEGFVDGVSTERVGARSLAPSTVIRLPSFLLLIVEFLRGLGVESFSRDSTVSVMSGN